MAMEEKLKKIEKMRFRERTRKTESKLRQALSDARGRSARNRKRGKYEGCCPNCDMMIADFDKTARDMLQKELYQCPRCEWMFKLPVVMKVPDVKSPRSLLGILAVS